MTVTRLPSGRWRVQVRRKTLKINETYDTEAEARAAEAEAVSANKHSERGMTLRQLWPRYEDSQLFEEKSENTQKTERVRIKPVLEALGDCTVTELEADLGLVYDYIEARRKALSKRTGKKLSNTSRRLEIAALSSLIEYAKQRRLIRENFISHISRPSRTKRKRRVAPVEQGKLALYSRNSDPRVATASRFLLLIRHLGCRPGELASALMKDLNLEARQITFRDTKNGTDRCVHITSDAAQLLYLQVAERPDKSLFVFPTWSKNKKAYVQYNYSKGVVLLRELGIIDADMHAHAGRREFISRAVEAGVPLLTIKKQTGHKTVQALEDYDEALATAPEIRESLDMLASKVQSENLLGVFEAAGMTPEQRKKVLRMLGEDGWTAPFGDK